VEHSIGPGEAAGACVARWRGNPEESTDETWQRSYALAIIMILGKDPCCWGNELRTVCTSRRKLTDLLKLSTRDCGGAFNSIDGLCGG